MRRGTAKTLEVIINAALRGKLDERRARRLHDLGPEAVALALLAVSKRVAEQDARIPNLSPGRVAGTSDSRSDPGAVLGGQAGVQSLPHQRCLAHCSPGSLEADAITRYLRRSARSASSLPPEPPAAARGRLIRFSPRVARGASRSSSRALENGRPPASLWTVGYVGASDAGGCPQSVPSDCGLQTARTVKSGLVESNRKCCIYRKL